MLDGPSLGALRRRHAAEPVRPTVFAGRAYPADSPSLAAQLDGYLADRPGADVFVILGVAHQYCANRLALTRKHFSTPFGTATTDLAYVEALAERTGPELFDDELAHRT